MKLTVCTLKKDGIELIVHSVVHAAPDSFFRMVQENIDKKSQQYKIFFEGVRSLEGLDDNASQEERDIEKHLNFYSELTSAIAETLGSSQEDKIKYPKGSINADIGFAELVKKLAENGFASSWQVKISTMFMRDEKIREKIKNGYKNFNKKIPILNLLGAASKFSFLLDIFSSEGAVLLHHRSKVAVDIVEAQMGARNILYYGESHIPEMLKLFKNNGWKEIGLKKIDLSIFK